MGSLHSQSLGRIQKSARQIYRSLFFPPLVIFIAVMFVTYWSFRASIAYIQRDQHISISNKREQVTTTIVNRLATYEQILSGGAGLFRASELVTEQEWSNYMSTFDIPNRHTEVQTIGYVKLFTAAELPAITQSMQAQGFPDFEIKPSTPRDVYTAVLYTMPERRSLGQGVDLYYESTRRSAMQRARDAGTATLTPPLAPMLDNTSQSVFQMYVAEYDEHLPTSTLAEREKAVSGYIFASFRTNDFFSKLLPVSNQDKDIGFQVISKHEDHEYTFYETPNFTTVKNTPKRVTSEHDIELYGQKWTVRYVFNSANLVSPQRRNAPVWTVIAGSLFAILLAEVIYLLLKARARELTSQRDRAVDLAKDELLSLASHQLRTPATTVKQYLGMVLQGFAGDINSTQENLLNKAYSGNERQLRIINEMLHVAKIDSGRITLAKQRTNLGELLKEVVAEIRTEADKAGHTLKLQLPKKPVFLTVDDHMLRMSVENLLTNAIKYTLKKGRIVVSLKRTAYHIHISVKDNGIGIAEKDHPRLYKLFTRLNNKQTQAVSGTGVGLYLAKHLVELHKGHINVQSEPGKGSTFTIILPVRQKTKS